MSDLTLDLHEHLKQASSEGGSLAAYARRHGLQPRQLYDLRYLQQNPSPKATKRKLTPSKQAGAFITVNTPTSNPVTTPVRIQLPNGVAIELTQDALAGLLPSLGQL